MIDFPEGSLLIKKVAGNDFIEEHLDASDIPISTSGVPAYGNLGISGTDINTVTDEIVAIVESNKDSTESNSTDITTLSGLINQNTNDITTNTSDITSLSGLVDQNTSDITASSGTLQSQITINDSDITTLSGLVTQNSNDISDNATDIITISGLTVQNASDIAGNSADITTLSGLIDQNAADIASASGSLQSQITINAGDISDNSSDIITLSGLIDQNTSDISDNTSDITTLSGFISQNTSDIVDNAADIVTLSGYVNTVSGNLSNEIDSDIQVALAESSVQVLFTTGTDLDVTQTELPIATTDENPGSLFTVNANNISCSLQGLYRITWLVEGQRGGGGVQRKNLRTTYVVNGTPATKSIASGYTRDSTNNHVSAGNTILVRTTGTNQTIGIRTEQQGTTGATTFTLSSGHMLVEYLGS